MGYKNIVAKYAILISFIFIFCLTIPKDTIATSLANEFYWDYIDSVFEIQDNGDLLVTEQQKYIFIGNNNHHRYRFFELNKRQQIEDIEVFEDKQPLDVNLFKKNHKLWIKWEDNIHDTKAHIFTLKYRVKGAIIYYEKLTRLYWQAIFPKRTSVINKAEITVNFPEKMADNLKYYSTVGEHLKQQLINNTTIKFNSLNPIRPKVYSDIKIVFSKNLLHLDEICNANKILACSKIPKFLSIFIIILLSIISIILRSTNFSGGGSASSAENGGKGGGG
ncbi:MAG: hypothetical protein Tsb0014_36380 [Pleurocapsa sp.]